MDQGRTGLYGKKYYSKCSLVMGQCRNGQYVNKGSAFVIFIEIGQCRTGQQVVKIQCISTSRQNMDQCRTGL